MSRRSAALFVRKATSSKGFLSKFLCVPPGENGSKFLTAGWCTGNSLKQLLVNSERITSKKAFNSYANYYQNVRGFRSGKTPGGTPGAKGKTKRDILLTALEDSGSKMVDRTDLIIKPFGFTAFVAGASFVGCSIWQYENYRRRTGANFSLSGWNENHTLPVAADTSICVGTYKKVGSIRRSIHEWWAQLPPGGDVFWAICGLNTLVFLAWKVPALSSFMVTYFAATPVSRAVCLPMMLSTFSHYSLMHLAANMFVLHSFMPSTVHLMGKENFVGFYLTAGAVSSLGSHLFKLLIGSNVPSLGASGAVMGILGYICTRMPESQLGVIFLPGFTFSADTALKCVLAVDTVGMLAGWRFMDHAAHLSGCLFGIAFSYFEKSLEPLRNSIQGKWHTYRNG